MNNAFPLEIEPGLASKFESLIAKDNRSESFIRVGVKGGGCSGYEYLLKVDTKSRPGDLETQLGSVRIVCDIKSAPYLEGAKLVASQNLIGPGFKFENPNVEKSCGCGSSFTPKPTLKVQTK